MPPLYNQLYYYGCLLVAGIHGPVTRDVNFAQGKYRKAPGKHVMATGEAQNENSYTTPTDNRTDANEMLEKSIDHRHRR